MSRGNTMNGKMIFLDIDGTLVSDLSAPSPLVKEAVRGTRKKGNKVFLCTGRNMPIIGREILEVGFDGVVASAGAHVEADGRILWTAFCRRRRFRNVCLYSMKTECTAGLRLRREFIRILRWRLFLSRRRRTGQIPS